MLFLLHRLGLPFSGITTLVARLSDSTEKNFVLKIGFKGNSYETTTHLRGAIDMFQNIVITNSTKRNIFFIPVDHPVALAKLFMDL